MAMHLNMDQVRRANNMPVDDENSVKLKFDETIGNDSIGAPTVAEDDKNNYDEIELNLSSENDKTTNNNNRQFGESPDISMRTGPANINADTDEVKDLRKMLERQQVGSKGSTGSNGLGDPSILGN